jgi:hypothetical protein
MTGPYPDDRAVSTRLRPADRTPDLRVVPRQKFVEKFGREYKSQPRALTMLGPSHRGKSRLCVELLHVVISPDLKALVLVGKPPGRERTWSDETAKKLNLRVIDRYPPSWDPRDKKRNGWMLRPRHTMTDPAADDAHLREQFRKGIRGAYATNSKHKMITVVDEGHHVHESMRLKQDCEAPLMRGLPDNAMWTLAQRGRFLSYLCYDAPEDIIIFKDDDEDNQARYGQITGFNRREIIEITSNLRTERVAPSNNTISQALYISRHGDMCIIDT